MSEKNRPQERLRCVVERITFQSDSYSVLKCAAKGFSDLVTVVGTMPDTHVGSVLTLGGFWKIDSRYGRQFQVITYEETLPATVYGIEKYLGSGLIKGIGPKYAKLIVNQFGAETLAVIETEPERLYEVPGIGDKRVERIKQSWTDQKEIRNIMLFLQGHDVSTAHAAKIYRQYGADSLQVVRENPYRLADDIWGIGFKTADTIAAKLGFEKDKFDRLRSGLIYTLNKLAEEGHCYSTRDQLLEAGSKLLEVEETLLDSALNEMTNAQDVITSQIPESDQAAIYLPPFYYSEIGVQSRLQKIAGTAPLRSAGEQMAFDSNIEYDETQLQAIHTAVSSKVMVLTGGPGTGKSTTTMGIIRAFSGQRVLLCAPTGRAAKRLSEVTGMEAKTIHRLLEFKPPEGCKRKEDNPLEGDVLIVDECSMVDVILMNALLRAVPDTMRLILVGDVDQLPSVGAGNVLRDIIESGVFPVITLTKIFRQAASSRIITNAHRINHGEYPDLSNSQGTDFFYQGSEDPEQAAQIIVNLVKDRLPKFYHVAPQAIQVLTPMQRGAVGAMNLNQLLQNAVNPPVSNPREKEPAELHRSGYTFRPGDKVMQIRNNYDKEVFNGDIGVIENIDMAERTLVIRFDDRPVEYDASGLDEIVLAYATTVHKAQGAEYPIVVMPVMMAHYMMLQRNLLYTGVTRAKKSLVLVGQKKAIGCCVRNVTVNRRNTLLAERLNGKIDRMPGNQRYICFDVETPNAANERMSAIGISVIEKDSVTQEFFSYVNPEQPFDYFNIQLTGIDAAKVAEAPTFAELWPEIEPILSGGILVAHNAPFDLSVLQKCLQAYGIQWKSLVRYLCTVRIGRAELPGVSHKLNDMCAMYEISLDHHQADSDSRACAEILLRYMRDHVKLGRYIRSFGMSSPRIIIEGTCST
ncbi:MAG: ATP-dependent RecD-like DNA helicase [Clostridia bacterium]|nr:ATP-dependent RecD-like DNA helicase [Clostridia bacterium]